MPEKHILRMFILTLYILNCLIIVLLLYPRESSKSSNSISFELCPVYWIIVLCHTLVCISTCHTGQQGVGDVAVDSSGVGGSKWNFLIGVWSENDCPFAKAIYSMHFLVILNKVSLAGQLKTYCLILYPWYKVDCLCL